MAFEPPRQRGPRELVRLIADHGGFPFPWPLKIPSAKIPAPPTFVNQMDIRAPLRTADDLALAWEKISEFFQHAPNTSKRIRFWGRKQGAKYMESAMTAWADVSPSFLLWPVFILLENPDYSFQRVYAPGMIGQPWLRKKYWDEFGNKYQREREIWPTSSLKLLSLWADVLQRADDENTSDVGRISVIWAEIFGGNADVYYRAADEDADQLQRIIDHHADSMNVGLWMYDRPNAITLDGHHTMTLRVVEVDT